MTEFYLGTHHASWLAKEAFREVPLFVSRRTLDWRRGPLPAAVGPFAVDSGGFTELHKHGTWDAVPPRDYAAFLRRVEEESGPYRFAAPQDWMCEPEALAATGLSVRTHQELTVANLTALRFHGARVIPVLQGWEPEDYLRHVEMYGRAGVDLTREPLVGLGTVCRRQDMGVAGRIVRSLAGLGLRLHGFGIKMTGLRYFADALASADSMAWSYDARSPKPTLVRCHTQTRDPNCPGYALRWRHRVLGLLGQERLEVGA